MRNVFTKVAAAAAILAGVCSSAHAFPYVELVITDWNDTDNVLFASKSCSTFNAASVASCAASGFGVDGVGATTVSFGSFLSFLGGAFNGNVGTFSITSTTAESNSPGTAAEAFLNRSQTSALRNAPGDGKEHSLLVDFRAYDFTDPNGEFKTLTASATMSANRNNYNVADSVVNFFSVDKFNGTGATASTQCTLTPTSVPANAALDESCSLGPVPWTDTFSPNSLFSMRSIQTYDVAVGSRINSTANSSVQNRIPEPVTTSLVAAALLGVGLASRRRASAQG